MILRLVYLSLLFTSINVMFCDTIASLRRPTVVIGFQSKLSNDPSAGSWFTRVLIRELQKYPAVRTPSADMVMSKLKMMGLKEVQALDLTNAAKITSEMGCVQFIIGSLTEGDSLNQVMVKFALYDAQTMDLEAEDSVTVNGGLGLYDALDDFQKELLRVLFDKETLSARLGLSISAGKANAFVNGGNYGEVQKEEFRWVRIKPKRSVQVEFKDIYTGVKLYTTNVILPPDTEKKLVYVPTAVLNIEGLPGAKIVRSDGSQLSIPTNGSVKTEMNAFVTDQVTIQTREKKYTLSMEPKVNTDIRLVSMKVYDPREIDYMKSWPFMSLVIPGFAQYQANDHLLGYFFAGLGFSGIGLTIFGFYANGLMDIKAQATTIQEDIRKFQTYGELYRTIGSIGIGIWTLTAVVSCVYGYWHPSRFIDPALPESPIAMSIGPDQLALEINIRI